MGMRSIGQVHGGVGQKANMGSQAACAELRASLALSARTRRARRSLTLGSLVHVVHEKCPAQVADTVGATTTMAVTATMARARARVILQLHRRHNAAQRVCFAFTAACRPVAVVRHERLRCSQGLRSGRYRRPRDQREPAAATPAHSGRQSGVAMVQLLFRHRSGHQHYSAAARKVRPGSSTAH